jgi:DNA modification methylase
VKPYLQDPDLTLYNGDALEVLRSLPDKTVDAAVTSPPYLDARPEYPSPTCEEFNAIFGELRRVVTGPLLMNVGRIFRGRTESLWWTELLREAWLQDWQPSYVLVDTGREKGNSHPAPMALDLALHLVALASWPGQTVTDPFAGSGTTAIAARRLGRNAVLIERDASYCALAASRLSQLSLLAEASA